MSTQSTYLRGLLLYVLLVGGCDSANDARPDSAVSTRDASQVPTVSISGIIPSHLATGLAPDTVVRLKVTTRNVPLDDAVTQVKAEALLTMRSTNTPISGSWTSSNDGIRANLVFTPNAPLTSDQEYLLQMPKTAPIKTERPVYAFRVGSLPRITSMVFDASPESGPVNTLVIDFSEPVKTDSVAAALKISVGGQLIPLELVNPGRTNRAALFKQPGGLDLLAEHTIEVGVDVGLPVKLDSQYVGQEGTSPFHVVVKPGDYASIKPWEPDLVF